MCALDVTTVQRVFSGHCTPCNVPKESWTESSSNLEVALLHRWLKANNAGQSTFNMMHEAGHVDCRRRALETSVGGRLIMDCDLAPAMQARWTVEHLCSPLTCARETMHALVLDTLSIMVIVMCILTVFEALYCPHMGRAPCTVPPAEIFTRCSFSVL